MEPTPPGSRYLSVTHGVNHGTPMALEADLASTATLLTRVRAGNEGARERLVVRYRALRKR